MPDFGIGETAAAGAASSGAAAAGTTAAVTSEAAAAAAAAGVADVGGSIAAADAALAGAAGSAVGAGSGAIFDAATTSGLSVSSGTLLSAAGTGFSALKQMQAGNAAKKAANYNYAIDNQQANAEAAGSQRQAFAQNQQTQLLMSRARAVGAASGASATSPSVVADQSQIQDRGDLNAMMDLYNGESRAQALREGAGLQEFQGQQAQQAAPIGALSTIMSGASSLYTRYSPNPFGGYQTGVS